VRFWPHMAERCADQDDLEHVSLRLVGDAETGADPGMTISGLSDTGVSPGRRFQPLILGLAVAIWALTHSIDHDSRDPSGLTLARQPGHSSASEIDRSTGALARLLPAAFLVLAVLLIPAQELHGALRS
jgi:hypothetical protein